MQHSQSPIIIKSTFMQKLFLLLAIPILLILPAGAQTNAETWMKVTLGSGYEKPVQIHIFADHYRSPWYAHYAITKGNFDKGTNPAKEHKQDMLRDGESTGWINISETVYPPNEKGERGGARLVIYPAYTYTKPAKLFKATIAFANKPDDAAIVKTFTVHHAARDYAAINIVVPPSLNTKENVARLRDGWGLEEEYGKRADHFNWPKAGKRPVQYPFFVSAKIDPATIDHRVAARALKTLSYFGFNGIGADSYFEQFGFNHQYISAHLWGARNGSFSAPDIVKMRKLAEETYQSLTAAGVQASDITYAILTDEPRGEALEKLAADKPSQEGFLQWIKSKNLTPQDLLVHSWDEVRIVTEADKSTFPALYYYSQQYRTIALGNYMAVQKKVLHEQWKSTFPVVCNFSDSSIYRANMAESGVDYFTLLHETDQNALWSEDWANFAATYQDASFNVELMRAAARKNGQTLGHYLIAYAGRKSYDIRLKAVSEVARGVKIFKSFSYGPVFASHEGGGNPWQNNSSVWHDQAAAVHEIGAVEDLLLPAMPQKAQVALLYSSASDIWNTENKAYGFERMHTWLALTHAQIPVDVVHESEVAQGGLAGYKVCYLSDPNITRAAAQQLAGWVQNGGTLIMTAGAGEKDKYNRPLDTLNHLLPYTRSGVQTLQAKGTGGRSLPTLKSYGTVKTGDAKIDILSVKQTFTDIDQNAQVKSTFEDSSPAALSSAAGKGRIICKGYLPAIDYMSKALGSQQKFAGVLEKVDANKDVPGQDVAEQLGLSDKSYNPWKYPAKIRQAIIAPVYKAHVEMPVKCNVPLVDAVYMTSPKGIVIPLANYTLRPIKNLTLDIKITKPIHKVRSVNQGALKYQKISEHQIRIHLPLDCTDFVTIE